MELNVWKKHFLALFFHPTPSNNQLFHIFPQTSTREKPTHPHIEGSTNYFEQQEKIVAQPLILLPITVTIKPGGWQSVVIKSPLDREPRRRGRSSPPPSVASILPKPLSLCRQQPDVTSHLGNTFCNSLDYNGRRVVFHQILLCPSFYHSLPVLLIYTMFVKMGKQKKKRI